MKSEKYYPVFLHLKNKKCVVVGGGVIAERKVRSLSGTGADITVISPEITTGLEKELKSGWIKHKKRRYRRGDASGAFLVIAATSDESVNRRVYEDSQGLINSVDMPSLCNFIVPSLVSKGPLQIAVSSSGLSPSIAKTIRRDIERHVPKDISNYLIWLKDIREKIKEKMPGTSRVQTEKRARLLKKLGSKEMIEMINKGGFGKARAYVEKMIEKDWEL